jgi:hypothetical protein
MKQNPIFIGGPDRSGTTLMYALLASHPNIAMMRRSNMWRYFYGYYGDMSRPENFERCLHDMTHYHKMRHLKPDPDRIRREYWQGKPSYGRLFALLHEHHAERLGKMRWGDKSLHVERFADDIFNEFPNAQVIQMVRDPRDRYASVRKRFGKDNPRLGASAARWLMAMRNGRRNLRRYPSNYRIVRYESLAQDPEATLREICDFLDEPYAPAMLTMQGANEYRESGGNSSFDKIEPGAISTRSIGRFRAVLSASEIDFLQRVCGREIAAYGYESVDPGFQSGERTRYLTRLLPVQFARFVGWWVMTQIDETRKGAGAPPKQAVDGASLTKEDDHELVHEGA